MPPRSKTTNDCQSRSAAALARPTRRAPTVQRTERKNQAMAKVEFKAKVETVYNHDDTIAFKRIKVPALSRNHCDMNAFRQHPKYGGFANSDLFPSILRRATSAMNLGNYIRLDQIPAAVNVDTSGFLARVSFDL